MGSGRKLLPYRPHWRCCPSDGSLQGTGAASKRQCLAHRECRAMVKVDTGCVWQGANQALLDAVGLAKSIADTVSCCKDDDWAKS
jgi:hypothetical protein